MGNEIPVDPSTPSAETIPITVDTGERPIYVPPEEIVNARAAKAAYGLVNLNRSSEDIQRQLSGGEEHQLRAQVAAELDMKQKKETYDTIQEITRRKGGPLSLDEIAQVTELVKKSNEVTDPSNVLEKEYSKRYIDYLGSKVSETWKWEPNPAGPDQLAIGKDFLTKSQILDTQIQNLEAAVKNQSYVGYGVDVAKNILSLGMYEEAKVRGQVPGTPFTEGLLGTNKEAQRVNLWRNNISDFTQIVTHIAETFGQDNPHDALAFLKAMKGDFDKDVDNIWSGVNFLTLPGTGALAKVGLKATLRTGTAVQDVLKSTKSTLPIKVAAAQGAGDLEEAAVQQQTANMVGNFQGTGNPLKQAVEALPKAFKDQSIAISENPGKGPGMQEVSNRIAEMYDKLEGSVSNVIANFQRGNRIPAPLAAESSIRLLKDAAKEEYFGNSSRVLDIDGRVGISDPYKVPGTTAWYWDYPIGNIDGTMFSERETAVAVARTEGIVLKEDVEQLGKERLGATIEQQGDKYFIKMSVPLDETSKPVRALLLSTEESRPASNYENVSGYLNSFLGWLRTGEETLSKDNMDMAKIALYGQNKLLALAKEELKDIFKMSRFALPGTAKKQRYLDLMDTLRAGRNGGMYDTVAELEDHYWKHYNRQITPQEASAYFSAKRYGQLQNTLNDMNVFAQESRLGAMNYHIRSVNGAGEEIGSNMFKAIELKEVPKNEEGFLLMSPVLGKEQFKTTQGLPKSVLEKIEKGELRLLEVLYPDTKPLKDFSPAIGNGRVKYIITDRPEASPLTFSKSSREGQGLWDLDYPFYLKQARMEFDEASKTWRYKGDKTLMPISNGGLGKDLLQHFEAVREAIKAGDYGAARQAALKLPIEWGEHASWYNETVGADGKIIPAKLNMNEPIKLVPGNKLIGSMDTELKDRFTESLFRDDTKGNRIFKNLIKGEQDTFDLYTIRAEGTRYNPLYKYEPAAYIDPIPSLNRAMKNITKSVFMDDYKTFAVEHWIQEAKGHLQATPEQLAHSPFYYFYHGEFNPGTDKAVVSRLTDARFRAQNIWGTPSSVDTYLHSIAQHMSDSIYSKGWLGAEALSGARGLHIDPTWMLAKSTDAARAVKSLTFHAILGLFTIPQFVVQNMGYATIAGIEGLGLAGAGTLGALLHQYSRLVPQHIDYLDKIASKLYIPSISNKGMINFKPGQFKEANQGLINSGFHLVGSDHAILDSMMTPKVIGSGKDMILDWGTIPFKEGEKNLRYGAWYTSYLKYRVENPFEAIDEKGWREIFSRATLLAGNMDSAAKSWLQYGPGQFTTQFLGYNLRVAELMTGKRLTFAEKARMFTTYSALFGVSAFGLSGLPAGDMIRKAAINNGYTANDGEVRTWLMEGIPSQLLHMITGTRYNVGARFGDPGFAPIREVMAGDKPTWQLIGGASTSFLTNAITAGDGFKRAVQSMFANSDEFFPLKADDLIQPLKATSIVNSSTRFIEALRSGDWLSRKGDIIDKGVTPGSALFMTLTGLQTQGGSDLQNMFGIEKDRKSELQETEKAWLREGERWIRAINNNDPTQAEDYGKRMRSILIRSGYPVELYGQLGARLEKSNQSLIERSNFNQYLGKSIPMPEREDKQKAYRRKQGLP